LPYQKEVYTMVLHLQWGAPMFQPFSY